MRNDTVSIGGASGFWGDSVTGSLQLVASGRLDFPVFDYLAKLIMSLLASACMKGAELGYATDFVSVAMCAVLKDALAQNTHIIASVGGVNPRGYAAALQASAAELGVSVRIVVVEGDDAMALLPALRGEGVCELQGAYPLPDKVVSVNAYLGALPTKAALDAGAQVVITGRCTDSAVTLGTLMYVFEWRADDYDRLVVGSLAGYILECGCQDAGGLYTDWEAVPDWVHSGYPVAGCRADDSFIVTKLDGTDGLVTTAIAGEQLLYEIGDFARYALLDVARDFTHVTMTLAGEHRVEVRGACGRAPMSDYKVSATYTNGYRTIDQLTIVGIDADYKVRHIAEAVLERTRGLFRQLGLPDYNATHIETLGSAYLLGPHQPNVSHFESVIWLAVTYSNKQTLDLFAREITSVGTLWASGTTDVGGWSSVVPATKQYVFLIDKACIQARMTLLGEEGFDTAVLTGGIALEPSAAAQGSLALPPGPTREVSLIEPAYARGDDKGDTSSIGVIARRPENPSLLCAQLTEDAVAAYLAHVVKGCVTRYDLPGIHASNFVCGQALGGGSMASLCNDPLGKGMAQVLLMMPVRVLINHP